MLRLRPVDPERTIVAPVGFSWPGLLLEQMCERHAEGGREPQPHRQPDVALAALKADHGLPVDACKLGEAFLR